MKIVKLFIENVKKIKVVAFAPKDGVVTIKGGNGHGKSSVIDSVVMAFTGKLTKDPIRKGSEKAKVIAETEKYRVTRTFTTNGSYLTVESLDGAKYGSPQTLLKELFSDVSIDPLEFTRMSDQGRRIMMLEMAGLDVIAIESRRNELYSARTAVNREGKAVRARFDAMPEYPDLPREMDDVPKLTELYRTATATEEKIRISKDSIVRLREEIAERQKQIDELEGHVMKAKTMICDTELKSSEYYLAAINEAADRNKKIEANNQKLRTLELLNSLRDQRETLNAEIEKIDQSVIEAVKKIKLPLENLSINDDGVYLDGILFSELSTAEQIRASMAIAMSQNPELRVMFIKEGSLLDEDSLKIVNDAAIANDYQVWMECVHAPDDVGVEIHEGEIVSIDGKPATESVQVPVEAAPKTAKRGRKPKGQEASPELDVSPEPAVTTDEVSETGFGDIDEAL